MPIFTLPSGIVSFDLPDATRLTAEEGPMNGWIAFGPHQQIFYSLVVADFSDVDDIEVAALEQALDKGETIVAVPTDRGNLFADVLAIDVKRGLVARKERHFLRLDRLPNGIVRILKIAPGRAEGESRAERAKMDALGLQVAVAARLAPEPTAFDRTAGRPGTVVMRIPNRVLCPLPAGWTAHDPRDFDFDGEADEDSEAAVCLGPDDAASMYVSTISMRSDQPLSAEDRAEALEEMRQEDLDCLREMDAMGETVEIVDPGTTRHLVRGGFEPSVLGAEGRHYRLRSVGPERMIVVDLTPILTDPDAGPDDARALFDPLDACIRRAYLFDGDP